jgi:hypothetical protein
VKDLVQKAQAVTGRRRTTVSVFEEWTIVDPWLMMVNDHRMKILANDSWSMVNDINDW